MRSRSSGTRTGLSVGRSSCWSRQSYLRALLARHPMESLPKLPSTSRSRACS
ncbi:hypothetical protein ACFPRL_22915 [Pseudoclavibacter helvolus]